ncbi:MAG TPA: hypothetical protein VNI61_04525, partial [Gemmatimonadales bacterium]|nr:hypothetical protein [Gemmatimonadales bacterium]
MTPGSALALFLVMALAWTTARWIRTRAGRTAAGTRFFRHPAAAPGIAVLVFFVLIALAAPLVAPYDPVVPTDILAGRNLSPSWEHVLGTDALSRDVWSRLVYGARVSLAIGGVAALLA